MFTKSVFNTINEQEIDDYLLEVLREYILVKTFELGKMIRIFSSVINLVRT